MLLGTHPSLAQDPAPPPDQAPAVQVPEVVVSATRTAEPPEAIPSAATVLTTSDIRRTPFRQGHQLDDLLRYVPGVQPATLSSQFNHPTAQSVSLRGLGPRRALVLLDGVPLNDGFGGWINWGLVPDAIDRVEVVPGGGSSLYGTWAMGGVIHVVTTLPRAEPGLSIEGRAGTLDTYTAAVHGRYRTDRAGLSLGYRWFHTNGFITVPSDQRGPVDQRDGASHQLFTGSLAWEASPRVELTLSGSLFREDRPFGTPLSLATRTIGTAALALTGDAPGGDRWSAKAFAQWQTFRNLTSMTTPFFSPLRTGEVRDRIQVVPSNDFGGQAQWSLPLGPRHRLVVGADARAILAQSEEEVFTFGSPAGRSLAEGKQIGWGVFGEWIARPIARLTLVPSVRLDWWRSFDGRIESESGAVSRPADNTAVAFNPKLALRYQVSDELAVAGAAYRAFRAPTLNELYRAFGFAGFTFSPNAGLSPERLWGGELSLITEGLPDPRVRFRLTGYYQEVEDQIVFISDGPMSSTRQNVGRTRAYGLELEGRVRLHALVWLTLGYTSSDSTIREFPRDPDREGKRIPFVSAHQVVAGLTIGRPEVIQLTLLGRYLSRQFADDRNQQPIAGFVVLDATLRRSLGEHAALYLDAQNLTDRDYIATQTGPIKTLGAPLIVTGGVRLEY